MKKLFLKKQILWYLPPLFCFSPLVFSFSSKQWITSRNIDELEQIVQEQKKTKELKLFCQLQLNKKRVPWACYEWIKKKPKTEKKIFLSYFNEKCSESSVYLKNPEKIRKILQQKNLSAFCRTRVRKQKKVIEYQLRDQLPSNIFKWYFTEEF